MTTYKYWLHVNYKDFSEKQWEDLCDRCGLCCYQQFITGYGKRAVYTQTSICCDLYDVENHCCSDYSNRKSQVDDCYKLTKNNIHSAVKWLPDTCSYKLLYQGKDLPLWHYLITNDLESVKRHQICRGFGIKESDVIFWEDWIIK